jgi:hypothetical protein
VRGSQGLPAPFLKVEDVAPTGYTIERATVRQRKTGRPVKFELTEQTRQAIEDYLRASGKKVGEFLFAIDWHLMGVLLVGSLPGIAIGSYCAHRVPETALQLVRAAILILVAGNLASHEPHSSSSIIAAFAPSAAH